MWIEPRGFEEVHTRGNVEQHRLQDAAKWVPYGVGAIEGSSRGSLPVLEPGSGPPATPTTSSVPAASTPNYGPGEEPRPPEGAPTASAHGELL